MSKTSKQGVHIPLDDEAYAILRAVVNQEKTTAAALANRILMYECRRLMRYRGTTEEITARARAWAEKRNAAREKESAIACDESVDAE